MPIRVAEGRYVALDCGETAYIHLCFIQADDRHRTRRHTTTEQHLKDDRNDQKRSRGPKEVLRVAIDAIENHLQALLARLPISNVSRQIK